VIGLGVGAQHALAYAGLDGCKLLYVYDLDTTKMQRMLGQLGQGTAGVSVEALLQDQAVDVVSIASYDDMHGAQVASALCAGKHVFVEKPLCRSEEELRAIKHAWQTSGNRHLASNLVLRAAPLYQWLRQAIAGGELGEIYGFDGDYLYGRLSKITDGWRKNVLDYSVMQGGGVHLVDLMLWLTGQRPRSVTSVGNRICTEGTAFHYHDYVSATFTFASGLVGRITANFGCVHSHQHVLRVFGTKGTFICDDIGPRLYTSRDPTAQAQKLDLAVVPASKGELIPSFIGAILKGVDTRDQTQHEFDVISACLGADHALATAKCVEIEYV